MTGWWARWVAHTSREVDSRPLRLVRALVAACLLGDLAAMAWRGALEAVLLPASAGGLGSEPSPQAWFAGAWWAGGLWYGVGWLALPWVFAGRAVRPALALALLASAQLGHLYVPGDRGIDRLLRTVLLVLLFSRATDDRPPVKVAAWPMDLLRWLLAIVYLQAGIAKLDAEPGFLDLHQPELYEILCEPAVGRLDPLTWRPVPWLFTAGGAVALALELSAPLLVTRWARWWAVGGALLHLGLAATMELGMFPFGMLALYPVLWSPWTERALDALAPRLPRWLGDWGPPGAHRPELDQLVRVEPTPRRRFGTSKGAVTVHADFDEPLSIEDLDLGRRSGGSSNGSSGSGRSP